jgi:methylamine---corrinoid protein Co-methyltransferase
MRNTGRILDIMERALTGPMMEEATFDKVHVTEGIKRVVADYDIKVDTGKLINQDDDMADRVWQAAIDFIVTCGVFSKDSGRVILHSRPEIETLLKAAPSEVLLGEGHDAVWERARKIEDPSPLVVDGCSIGTPIPEEYFVPAMISYIQEPIVDVTCGGSLETVQGFESRTGSPLEILSTWEEMDLAHLALKRAGRPGMAYTGCMMAMSDIGQISAAQPGGLRPTDLNTFGIISELKANYEIFNKVTHTIRTGGIVDAYANAIYGGLGGGPDGHAVLICAEMIALSVVFQATCVGASPTHPFLFCSTERNMMASASVAFQAIARNSHLMTNLSITAVGGPVTKTLLYETLAYSLMASLSGNSRLLGPRPATGVISGHYTGLEARFMGEVCHASTKLNRESAEVIAQKAFAKCEPDFEKKPYGKPFWEAYDVRTIKPTDEWQKMVDGVRDEAKGWGLSFD